MNQRITDKEYKKELIKILDYIHQICVTNGIKYSLIGGSLIGAIRNQGIIPWDDDIDIILDMKNYAKLLKTLSNDNNEGFRLLTPDLQDYPYPFPKLVSTRTSLNEIGGKAIKNYGVYVDIFAYRPYPRNRIMRYLIDKQIRHAKKGIGYSFKIKEQSNKTIKDKIKKIVFRGGMEKWKKRMICLYDKLPKYDTGYVCIDWPGYDYGREIQKTSHIKKYLIVKFENIEAMVFKDYDEILKKTFGDYMALPPIEKRISNHSFEAFWVASDKKKV